LRENTCDQNKKAYTVLIFSKLTTVVSGLLGKLISSIREIDKHYKGNNELIKRGIDGIMDNIEKILDKNCLFFW